MKNEGYEPMLDRYFSGNAAVRAGKMFGYPAYYVGRTMFACLYEGNVGLKIPEEVANKARSRDDISEFVRNELVIKHMLLQTQLSIANPGNVIFRHIFKIMHTSFLSVIPINMVSHNILMAI